VEWLKALSSSPSTVKKKEKKRKKKKYRQWIVLFCFGGTGVWTQGFILAKQMFYAWATPSVYFALVILQTGNSRTFCPGWPQPTVLQTSAFQVAGIIDTSHWCLVTVNLMKIHYMHICKPHNETSLHNYFILIKFLKRLCT
jgi:hypothetical protein